MSRRPPSASAGSQRGAALLVVLILLLVMTLVGLASMRSTLLEERMSASVYDRGISFQASEAALREAEALAASGPAYPTAAGCVNGLCAERPALANTDVEYWLAATGVTWRNATANVNVDNDGAGAGAAIATTPQYLIEPLGVGPNWFACERQIPPDPLCLTPRLRVTARTAPAGRSQVVLQTTVSTP